MNYSHVMVMVSSLLIGNSVLFAIYFLWGSSANQKFGNTHKLIGFLLIAFALRITKSVIFILYPEYSNTLTSIGIVGMLSIGPLFWFYLRSICNKTKFRLAHFLPSLIIAGLIPWLKGIALYQIYLFSLAHMFTYLTMGFYLLYKNRIQITKLNQKDGSWLWQLTLVVTLIWTGFLLQAFIHDKLAYVGITSVEVMVFFAITLIGMKNYKSLISPLKNTSFLNIDLDLLAKKAKVMLVSDRLYEDSNLTLSVLAKKVGTSNHVLSYAINSTLNKSFPELVNFIRIEQSKSILKNISHRNLSIEAIAYECGFSSLSVFYSNFKKHNKMTPKEYRRRQLIVE